MASNQKRQPDFEHLIREFENASVDIRSQMAGRTAAEMLYDECVLTFMATGRAVEWAVLYANQLYPSEALEVTAESIEGLESHYYALQRISFVDNLRDVVTHTTTKPIKRAEASPPGSAAAL